jgi:hypothetical protein
LVIISKQCLHVTSAIVCEHVYRALGLGRCPDKQTG